MHYVVPKSIYFKVSVWLFALMIATVVASQIDLEGWNVPLAMVIAAAKATLIVLFFMHVRYGSPLVRLFAMSGFVWLAILFAFVAADVLTRNWAG
jgi:cytochrome c oxidase subunit IV